MRSAQVPDRHVTRIDITGDGRGCNQDIGSVTVAPAAQLDAQVFSSAPISRPCQRACLSS